jgi:hypothetical protein
MNRGLEIFRELVETKKIDFKDFYSVTFTNFELSMQGDYKSSLLKKFVTFFDGENEICKNGHITIKTKYNNFRVRIILTVDK